MRNAAQSRSTGGVDGPTDSYTQRAKQRPDLLTILVFRNPDYDAAFEQAVKTSEAIFEEFLYHDDTHVFTDTDLPDYNEVLVPLLRDHMLRFLESVNQIALR